MWLTDSHTDMSVLALPHQFTEIVLASFFATQTCGPWDGRLLHCFHVRQRAGAHFFGVLELAFFTNYSFEPSSMAFPHTSYCNNLIWMCQIHGMRIWKQLLQKVLLKMFILLWYVSWYTECHNNKNEIKLSGKTNTRPIFKGYGQLGDIFKIISLFFLP